ncbi:LysR family transcriptional regulator [Actinosynnema sp. NPDC020468]|uniref:LysR family transcriptional regulator n=1 Tax=Actinosynnema sp. NPDC020468 TaxID=3154488 RepID=UPI0033CE1AC5
MDLDAVRTFVAVVDAGRFQEAADDLTISQQAVSKRVAALEKRLGARLFARTPRGVRLTADGEAFLPHARALLLAEHQAIASVRPGRRALRVDVIGRRAAPAGLLHDFHRAHPAVELDVVTLFDADTALAAVRSGTVDASFRAVDARRLPAGLHATEVFTERLHLVTGPRHPLADATTITPADLAGHRIWMPGIAVGTEWAAYYADLAAAFDLAIDARGPHFGLDAQLDEIAESADVATLLGEQTPVTPPADARLRHVPIENPAPVYPHSLVHHADNAHPALAALRDHLGTARRQPGTWTPEWAR